MKGWLESPRYSKSHSSLAAAKYKRYETCDQTLSSASTKVIILWHALTPSSKWFHLNKHHPLVPRREPNDGRFPKIYVLGYFIRWRLWTIEKKFQLQLFIFQLHHKHDGLWALKLTVHWQAPPPRFKLNLRVLSGSSSEGILSFTRLPSDMVKSDVRTLYSLLTLITEKRIIAPHNARDNLDDNAIRPTNCAGRPRWWLSFTGIFIAFTSSVIENKLYGGLWRCQKWGATEWRC